MYGLNNYKYLIFDAETIVPQVGVDLLQNMGPPFITNTAVTDVQVLMVCTDFNLNFL